MDDIVRRAAVSLVLMVNACGIGFHADQAEFEQERCKRTQLCADGADDSGRAGAGGAVGHAGGGDSATCPAGQKLCSGVCLAPAPLIGCSLQGCERCPEPLENSVALCEGIQCKLECNLGYVPRAGRCEPSDAGGSGGVSGADGSAGTSGAGAADGSVGCVPSSCPRCNPAGPIPCCRSNRTCGCTWAPGAVCY